MKQSRDELPRALIAWGLVLAMVGFLLPLVLNQLLNLDFLHRLHKFLAFIIAFVVFAAFPLAQVFGNLLRLAVMDVPPLVVVVLGAGLYKR